MKKQEAIEIIKNYIPWVKTTKLFIPGRKMKIIIALAQKTKQLEAALAVLGICAIPILRLVFKKGKSKGINWTIERLDIINALAKKGKLKREDIERLLNVDDDENKDIESVLSKLIPAESKEKPKKKKSKKKSKKNNPDKLEKKIDELISVILNKHQDENKVIKKKEDKEMREIKNQIKELEDIIKEEPTSK